MKICHFLKHVVAEFKKYSDNMLIFYLKVLCFYVNYGKETRREKERERQRKRKRKEKERIKRNR